MIKNRFGRIEDKFFRLIPKALAFRPIDDIKDFVYSYVLDEKEVNIDVLRENVRTYQDLQRTLENVKTRIGRLEKINIMHDQAADGLRKDRQYEYYLARVEADLIGEDIDKKQSEIQSDTFRLEEQNRQIGLVRAEQAEKQQIRDDLRAELATDKDFLAVEQNRNPCYMREFSIKYFQDSKYFEQIESRIAKVFRQFSGGDAEIGTQELLAEYGIYRTPNYVYFKGDIRISVDGEIVDLFPLKQGIGISGEDLPDIRFSDLGRIKKVITIENLTSFFRYGEEHSLVIYLGGYHNRIRRALLKMIYETIPDAKYYHFGDIDAGGFSILLDLRKKTGIPFLGYHMDLDTLKRYMQYGKCLTESDRKRLEKMGKEEEFCEIIGFMLKENIKLEQECII